jgi:exonuclease III
LVREKKPLIVCLQETKLQACDDSVCTSVWGSSSFGFSFRPSVGASGGLLTVWDTTEVEVWSLLSRDHVLWCHGRFIKTGEDFMVANVYAPCEPGAKQGLWGALSLRLQSLIGMRVCVCGDFNAFRSIDERCSASAGNRPLDHIGFSRFIDDNSLIDLPLCGRKFTWYRGDGLSMSRLDRFLLSEEWRLSWPNCKQEAQLRGLSDHCALVLASDEANWGPRPLRMLKCWRDVPGYSTFVKEKWQSLHVDGWGGFVLKEKLKLLKGALKEWHLTHSHNLSSRIDSLKVRLSALDLKGEEDSLSEVELGDLHEVTADLHSLSRLVLCGSSLDQGGLGRGMPTPSTFILC